MNGFAKPYPPGQLVQLLQIPAFKYVTFVDGWFSCIHEEAATKVVSDYIQLDHVTRMTPSY